MARVSPSFSGFRRRAEIEIYSRFVFEKAGSPLMILASCTRRTFFTTSSARNSTISIRRGGVIWSVRKTFTVRQSSCKVKVLLYNVSNFFEIYMTSFEFGFHTWRKIVVSRRRYRIPCLLSKTFQLGKNKHYHGHNSSFSCKHGSPDDWRTDQRHVSYRRRLTIAAYKIFKNINIDYKISATADIIYRCW